MKGTKISSKFPADQMIERITAAAMDQEIERRDEPHQRIFHAELVPEIAADPPALEIGHDQEQHQRQAGQAPASGPRSIRSPRSTAPRTTRADSPICRDRPRACARYAAAVRWWEKIQNSCAVRAAPSTSRPRSAAALRKSAPASHRATPIAAGSAAFHSWLCTR